jgi:hypothetical protein
MISLSHPRHHAALAAASQTLREGHELARLRAELREARAEIQRLQGEAAERAQRRERLARHTLRVVDRVAEWKAKMGLRRLEPRIVVSSQFIHLADS